MAKFKDIVIPVSKREQWILDHMIPAYLYQIDRMTGNLRSSFQEYVDIYTGYREELNFHSPQLFKWSKDPKKMTGCFKISIGAPRLKGSRAYRLPNMSLLLYMGDTNPYIVTDIKHELKEYSWDNLKMIARKMYALKGGDEWNLTKVSHSNISTHPHVSSDITPCLGYFSEAMGTTVSTGNLPTLKEVAFSFACNWTRNDAYWDINDEYRSWSSYKPATTFKDYLMLKHTLDAIFRMGPSEQRYYISDMAHTDIEYLHEKGWKREDLYVYSRLFNYLRNPNKDTSDGKIKYMLDISKELRREYTDKMRTISSGVEMMKNLNCGPLIDRAIVNNARECTNTHNSETENIGNFQKNMQSSEAVSRMVTQLANLYEAPSTYSRERAHIFTRDNLLNMKRMVFRDDFRTINTNISMEEAFKKIAVSLCYISSNTSGLTRNNGWLFVVRSVAKFARFHSDIEPLHCEEDEFDRLFTLDQTLAYFKQYKMYCDAGIHGLDGQSEEDMLNRIAVNAGKQVYQMLSAIGPILCSSAFQQRWRHFITGKVKNEVIKQMRNNIRSLENERNNNIHRCNVNGLGVQTFDSYDDGSENQISIAAF